MAGVPVLILVFALIVWVVVQVVRAQQNEVKNNQLNQQNRRNPFENNRAENQQNNPEANRTPERSSANDIDRFLQEIDRLRQRAAKPKDGEEKPAPKPQTAQQQAQASSPPTQQPQRPRPTPPRPQPQPRAQPPARPQPAPRPEPPRPVAPAPVPTPPAPMANPAPAVSHPSVPSLADQKFAEFSTPATVTTTSSLVGAAPAVKVKAKNSEVVDLIRTMLKQPKGFAAALLLKEILDAPRSAKR